MKKRPEALARALGALLLVSGAARGADLPAALTEDWYQVEVLVFVRDEAIAADGEEWEPLPELAYVAGYRYLVDPDLADRRLDESGAYASRIDERGVQHLTVPSPVAGRDDSGRPDALINEPYVEPIPPGEDGLPASPTLKAPPLLAAPEPQPEEPEPLTTEFVPLVRPEVALGTQALDFRPQAATLRRRGQRVLFHEAWWVRLEEDGPRRTLLVDRAADMDRDAWPELQGSLSLYRSRYLHAEVDLWVNTMAPYLPPGWQIDAPSLATPSLTARTLRGDVRNTWAPEAPVVFPGLSPPAPEGTPMARAEEPIAPEVDAPLYPWHHAIRHAQTRRMRSGEVHYLDHPVIGIIVRLRSAGEGLLPIADEDDLAFRERHGLPVETVELPLDWATKAP